MCCEWQRRYCKPKKKGVVMSVRHPTQREFPFTRIYNIWGSQKHYSDGFCSKSHTFSISVDLYEEIVSDLCCFTLHNFLFINQRVPAFFHMPNSCIFCALQLSDTDIWLKMLVNVQEWLLGGNYEHFTLLATHRGISLSKSSVLEDYI
jgi:hypothetical protein